MTVQMAQSWYQPELTLSKEQEAYVKIITKIFNMKTETGLTIPYVPTPYQVEFHAESINVLQEAAQDILFVKARGVSFTMCSCIELIMSAGRYKNQTFPVIAQRFDTAKGIVNTCKWLINNATVPELKEEVEFLETEVKFLDTGSVIRPYPSGSAADSVRGLRLIRAVIDEYAFQQRDKELLAAVQDAMVGKFGQIIIGSTPCGISNHFYDLVQKPVGFKVFRLPAFDETKFDINKNIFEQKIIPIAPWLDLSNLETKRERDSEIFKQENMCSFMDDSISYLPFSVIKRCENAGLVNYLHVVEQNPDFEYDSQNPIYAGIDVARSQDLTAITLFEKTYIPEDDRYVMVQKYMMFIKDKSLPKQQAVIDRLLKNFPQVVKVRVDMTGLGLGLFEYLRKKHGSKIEGIHFAESVATGTKHKAPITERMSVNLKNMMQEEPPAINLIVDDLQEKHLNDVDYNFKAIRRIGEGHGDMFYAVCLAVLPDNYRAAQTGYFRVQEGTRKDRLPILEAEPHFEIVQKAKGMTWEDKLKYLEKNKGKSSLR